uniref:Hexosyltransferase n=1 Tax=Panagrolaimus davidi TaxID=227884 RepID=A0A914Q3H6_9BILA
MPTKNLNKKFFQYLYLISIFSSCYLIYLTAKFIKPDNYYSVNEITRKVWKRSSENEKNVENFLMGFKDFNISYQFFTDKRLECNEKQIVIIIPSRPNGFDNRMGIRSSWLQNLPPNVIYKFILGSTKNETLQELIKNEDEEFQDLIFSTLHESYSNLTLKTYSIFQWTQKYCPTAKYLLKTDDDTVVDVRRLQYWIEKHFDRYNYIFDEKVIFCKVWTNSTPFRDPEHKWYIPEYAFNETVFPNFCSGPTYLLTAKAIPAILKETPKHYFIQTEDAFFTGIVSEAAGIYRFQKDKHFGHEPEIGNLTIKCDLKGIPFLTSIYGISFNGTIFNEDNNNPFKGAMNELFSLSCNKSVNSVLN